MWLPTSSPHLDLACDPGSPFTQSSSNQGQIKVQSSCIISYHFYVSHDVSEMLHAWHFIPTSLPRRTSCSLRIADVPARPESTPIDYENWVVKRVGCQEACFRPEHIWRQPGCWSKWKLVRESLSLDKEAKQMTKFGFRVDWSRHWIFTLETWHESNKSVLQQDLRAVGRKITKIRGFHSDLFQGLVASSQRSSVTRCLLCGNLGCCAAVPEILVESIWLELDQGWTCFSLGT